VLLTVIVGLLTNQLTSHWGWFLGAALIVATVVLAAMAWWDKSTQQRPGDAATITGGTGTVMGSGNSVRSAGRDVVQIGRAHNVYLNEQRSADRPPPRLLPPTTKNFTNQDDFLDKTSAKIVHGGDRDGPKVVVIQGSPGIGTSQAALRLAHRLKAGYPYAQLYADLGSRVGESELVRAVLGEFLIVLGFTKDDLPDSAEARAGWFRSCTEGQAVLVVLDGAFSAEQVRMLLPGPGKSLVVVTERAPLSDLSVTEAVLCVELRPLEKGAAKLLLTRIIGSARLRPNRTRSMRSFAGAGVCLLHWARLAH
jgi:hypothetical protein